MNQKRHDGPPTWESRVRGLMLGLALGDAIGSKGSDIPRSGVLDAGAATQLAAWTTEGLLRAATRYGGNVINNSPTALGYAYQRWALLRGGKPTTPDWHPVFEDLDLPVRGWLLDVPAMAAKRGSSPSTLKGVLTGKPTHSRGCQATLRGLPTAAFGAQRVPHAPPIEQLTHYARGVAALTHRHPDSMAAASLAVHITATSLRGDVTVAELMRAVLSRHNEPVPEVIAMAEQLGRTEPCVPQHLERLAPDKTGVAALAGGIYVALSFPEPDAVAEALEFAGWAPDGDSVAAMAGAMLGALHGFEALPVGLVSRLELGWVMDRLATDLALQVRENQAGTGWKSDIPEPGRDPWWDTKYPGV